MPTEILMPALSPTMEEGKLAKWLVKEGQQVKAGDIIAEIETDKATMEVEAVDEGKVGKLLVAEGTEGVKVNTPIAVLLGDGESCGRGALGQIAARLAGDRELSLGAGCAAASLHACARCRRQRSGGSCRRCGGRSREASARARLGDTQCAQPHLGLAVGAPARQGSRARPGGSGRLGAARAHRQE